MKNKGLILVVFFALILGCDQKKPQPNSNDRQSDAELVNKPAYALAIHGGAGYRKEGDAVGDSLYEDHLAIAVSIGEEMLKKGASAVDVVEKVLQFLENDSLFNAGKGAVFTASGTHELDASIMSGKDLKAGAVAGVKSTKNPIRAARLVMDSSVHVMLSGNGADQFAREQGLEQVNNDYFHSGNNYLKWLEEHGESDLIDPNRKFGTVGCVVLDKEGNLAAGTSTGGMSDKKWGRIGDSPVIGAGTYADNKTCAVSATGHGEYFIRNVVAYQIAAQMAYREVSLEAAASDVVHRILTNAGGVGGVICLDKDGNISMPFNTPMMFRAWVKSGGAIQVGIY